MSLYVQFDEAGEQAQVASNTGWTEFTKAVEGSKLGALIELVDTGITEDVAGLLSDLENVTKSGKLEQDCEDIAKGLLEAVQRNKDAGCVMITNGSEVDTGDDKEPVNAAGEYFGGDPVLMAHDELRSEIENQMAYAVNRAIAVAEAEAVAKVRTTRKRHRKDLNSLMRSYEGSQVEESYAFADSELAQLQGIEADDSHGAELAIQREDLLVNFNDTVIQRFQEVLDTAEREKVSKRETLRRIKATSLDLTEGIGERVVKTETQAIYGAAQLRVLKRAGISLKKWVTCEDDKVRPSHVECGDSPAIPMDRPFPNGLQFPGDPDGGPEEVCNCRCWLVPGYAEVTASSPHDVSDEPRDEHGRWTATETPKFKEWFGNSKVVDKDGKPLVVSHGTYSDVEKLTEFRTDLGSAGIYFTPDKSWTMQYAKTPGHVVRAYVRIEHPAREDDLWRVIGRRDASFLSPGDKKLLEEAGFDGVIAKERGSGKPEIVAFHPTQIKSATGNGGQWSKDDPDITASQPSNVT